MGEVIQAIILGIVQGLTEFLPVSSSGHLEIAKKLLGQNHVPKESLLMTTVLHAATAIGTLWVFRAEVRNIIKGLFQFKNNEEFQFSLKIIISMIPAGLVGVFFMEELEAFFTGDLFWVGVFLLVTALLLILTERVKKAERNVSYLDALIVGVAQMVATLPGISRSGATISTSVLLGIDKERAARFSFLMVVPLILAKMLLDVKEMATGSIQVQGSDLIAMAFGFLAALFTGILACQWMIRLVKSSRLWWFGIYCVVVGLIAIISSYLG